MTDGIKKKQADRFQVLQTIYENDGGGFNKIFYPGPVAEALEMPEDEVERIFTYLDHEG